MGGLSRVTGFWEGLTGPSRRLIVGAVLIFVVGIILLMKFSGQTSYATLVSSASADDAAAITSQLNDSGIRYKLTDGGTTVQVPASDLDQARLDLASSNLLDGGGVGFEIFDKSNLGATDFTNRVNLVRATEGELSRTISRLDPVQSATVKIAMPEEQLFTDEQQPTTAAVVVATKTGQDLDAGQVKGITKLVAMAVPGLKVADVTVTDSQGNILEGGDADVTGTSAASDRLKLQSTYERGLQGQLDAMMAAVLGPGKAVTKVNAVLDLDKTTTDSETYNKDSLVPLESDTSKETLKSAGGAAGSVAGTSANTPTTSTFPSTGTSGGDTNYNKTSEATKNGVDRVRSQVEKVPGHDHQPGHLGAGQRQGPDGGRRRARGHDQGGRRLPERPRPDQRAGGALRGRRHGGHRRRRGGQGGHGHCRRIRRARHHGLRQDRRSPPSASCSWPCSPAAPCAAGRPISRRPSPNCSSAVRCRSRELSSGFIPSAPVAAIQQLEGQRKTPIEAQMEDLALRKPEDVAQLLRGWLLGTGGAPVTVPSVAGRQKAAILLVSLGARGLGGHLQAPAPGGDRRAARSRSPASATSRPSARPPSWRSSTRSRWPRSTSPRAGSTTPTRSSRRPSAPSTPRR